MKNGKLIVSPSPHIHGPFSTKRLMSDVLIALIPAFIVSVIVYGVNALIVTAVSVAGCVLFEYLIQKYLLKGAPTIGNLSAIVTGVLLGFNLPSTLPIWMILLGALVAIGVGKMSFGGLGCNPFNPALVGRVFLLISFPVQMTGFATPPQVDSLSGASMPAEVSADVATDAITGPTLLGYVKESLANGMTTADLADKGHIAAEPLGRDGLVCSLASISHAEGAAQYGLSRGRQFVGLYGHVRIAAAYYQNFP